jgi:zinc protease
VNARTKPELRAQPSGDRVSFRLSAWLTWTGIVLATGPTLAGEPESGLVEGAPALEIRQKQLDNGLRVIAHPDHASPTVAVCSVYGLEPRPDGESHYAVARLTERMLREGNAIGELSRVVASRGGRLESGMAGDRMRFCTVVPSGELELALWVESMRPAGVALTRENLDRQRALTIEDYRAEILETAYARGWIRLQQLAFQGYPLYQPGVLDTADELSRTTLEQVRHFHAANFTAGNAVLSIAGDFEPGSALGLVTRYLGAAYPPGKVSSRADSELRRQSTERLSVIEDIRAKTPGIYWGWVIPPPGTREQRALEVASVILGGGESSLMHQVLVREKALSQSAGAWIAGHHGADLLTMELVLASGRTPEQAKKQLELLLERLRHTGPNAEELQRAKTQLRSQLLFLLQSNERKAVFFAELALRGRSVTQLGHILNAYSDITGGDVRKAIAAYLIPARRTVVEVYPPEWREPAGAPLPQYYLVSDGDTLIGIAKRRGVSWEALVQANGIDVRKPIFPGQKLVIPRRPLGAARTHIVKKGETLIGIAKANGLSIEALAAANGLNPKKPIFAGQRLSLPPSAAAKARR